MHSPPANSHKNTKGEKNLPRKRIRSVWILAAIPHQSMQKQKLLLVTTWSQGGKEILFLFLLLVVSLSPPSPKIPSSPLLNPPSLL